MENLRILCFPQTATPLWYSSAGDNFLMFVFFVITFAFSAVLAMFLLFHGFLIGPPHSLFSTQHAHITKTQAARVAPVCSN